MTAEPTAKRFTEGQLKPAADKVAANAKPMADKFNKEQLLPTADKIAQNARPAADRMAEQQIKPAAQKVSDQAVPRTKDFTEGTLQPGAKRLADNAEPMGDKLIKEAVEPLANVSAATLLSYTHAHRRMVLNRMFRVVMLRHASVPSEGPCSDTMHVNCGYWPFGLQGVSYHEVSQLCLT